MEKIKFDNLQNKRVRILMILAVIFILVGVFNPFNFFSAEIHKWMSVLGFLLQAILFSRMFWFKNYVQWNKKGIVIKINSWIGFGKSIRFDEIKSINFEGDTIELTLFGGNHKRIVNISNIVLEDREQLHQIIQKYATRKKG